MSRGWFLIVSLLALSGWALAGAEPGGVARITRAGTDAGMPAALDRVARASGGATQDHAEPGVSSDHEPPIGKHRN